MGKVVRVFTLAYLAILAVAFVTGYHGLWGAYHLRLFPTWLAFSLLAVSAIIVMIPAERIRAFAHIENTQISNRMRIALMIAIPAVCAVFFIMARSKNLMLGDSYKLLSQITGTTVFMPTEHVNMKLLAFVYSLTGNPWTSFLLIGIVGGMVFLTSFALFGFRQTKNLPEYVGVLLAFLALAQILFFFGYVENYALLSAFTALFLFLGWRSLTDRRFFGWAALSFVFACAFHLSAAFLLPGLIYLLVAHLEAGDKRAIRKVIWIIGAVIALGIAVAYVRLDGMGVFVPLFETRFSPYTLFSFQHLTDIVNLLLLIAPLPLLIGLSTLVDNSRGLLSKSKELWFFGWSTAGGLCLLFFVDPKLGAVRDWDLLALYGIPLVFLALRLSFKTFKRKGMRFLLAQISLAVLISHTIPWVASNSNPAKTLPYLKKVIAHDIHYTPDYYEADRLMAWGNMVEDLHQDLYEKKRCFKTRVQVRPDDVRAWMYYTKACSDLNLRDEAVEALRHLREFDGLDEKRFTTVVQLALNLGETGQALQTLNKWSKTLPESFSLMFLYGTAYQADGDMRKAMECYSRALSYKQDHVGLLLNYAKAALAAGNLELAEELVLKVESIDFKNSNYSSQLTVLKQMILNSKPGPEKADLAD